LRSLVPWFRDAFLLCSPIARLVQSRPRPNPNATPRIKAMRKLNPYTTIVIFCLHYLSFCNLCKFRIYLLSSMCCVLNRLGNFVLVLLNCILEFWLGHTPGLEVGRGSDTVEPFVLLHGCHKMLIFLLPGLSSFRYLLARNGRPYGHGLLQLLWIFEETQCTCTSAAGS
jgi:hypothetical protein